LTMVRIPNGFQDVLRPHLPYADSSEISAADELVNLGLDSVGVVRLLADIEDKYEVELPDDILDEETFVTAGSLWQRLSALVALDT
jgi:acyl carrier protein